MKLFLQICFIVFFILPTIFYLYCIVDIRAHIYFLKKVSPSIRLLIETIAFFILFFSLSYGVEKFLSFLQTRWGFNDSGDHYWSLKAFFALLISLPTSIYFSFLVVSDMRQRINRYFIKEAISRAATMGWMTAEDITTSDVRSPHNPPATVIEALIWPEQVQLISDNLDSIAREFGRKRAYQFEKEESGDQNRNGRKRVKWALFHL